MMNPLAHSRTADDLTFLDDDTDLDTSQLLTVICDGDPRSNRGFDFDATSTGGAL